MPSSDSFRTSLIEDQISSLNRNLRLWRFFEIASYIIGEILTGAGVTLVGINVYYHHDLLAYLAISFGSAGIGLRSFSSYCYKQSQVSTQSINSLLIANGEQPIPDTSTPLNDDRVALISKKRPLNYS